jgi:hypothetical protein
MVNVRCRDKNLLEIVAEECFHFFQDRIHGAGWRARTVEDIIEREAREFVRLKNAEIQRFLDDWNADREAG